LAVSDGQFRIGISLGGRPQDPGLVDLVTNKKADIVRVYFAPDANYLLWIADHCLRTYDRVNVIVAGKQPAPQWLTLDEAIKHCDVGIGI
jgi:xylulose-5-phosphate/fructose-6-phosphate phosphoketolase